ncbi:DUF1002 domain-containing protein [Romboutsia ilealis]|uniref:DUF1002 domain-containing protein n=1 Tax=Romboutsia faecis TaxID=2764597 RepID=A0ABR7JKQ5_9FIRM|nr:DUF1002 domain-containing protein [Romboutsia faecis]MBC5995181.1 DUF1002 domain-containing protein [Romboutsia faecis]MRN25899.1 DUF1002 domain-containing protein [Romboutsia ilealis]
MKIKKKITSLILCGALFMSSINFAFADSSRVVTLGANLSKEQRATMLKYFGVNENEVVIIEVNNQEERKYLQGVATEEQLGRKTFSCAYVEPTKTGSGINVKTANITWATSSMIASIMSTCGIENANVVAAAPFPVSGTGMMTGIMKAFEDATGEPLDETKKEIASEELIITGDLADEIGGESGQDKATGIINDIKTEIIKNNTSDTIQIADTINNITNNYNVTLTPEQEQQIKDLMKKIANQDYDYNSIKNALNSVKDNVNENLSAMGENPNSGLFDSIKGWFNGIGNWVAGIFEANKDLGILENTNDNLLGDGAQIDATDKDAINLPSSEQVEGLFSKIWNWFTGLFSSNNNSSESNTTNESTDQNNEAPVENNHSNDVPTSNTDNNTNQDSSNESSEPVENSSNNDLNSSDNNQENNTSSEEPTNLNN